MSQKDQNQHIENSDGSDAPCHINLSPPSPNGHPFRVPGRRTRTTSDVMKLPQSPFLCSRLLLTFRDPVYALLTSHSHWWDPERGMLYRVINWKHCENRLTFNSIEGDIVPKEGDEVTYKRCLMPPKNEKFAAVHVHIAHQAPVVHEKWDKDAIERPICSANE